jgi:Domain of unknown function (DUF4124)
MSPAMFRPRSPVFARGLVLAVAITAATASHAEVFKCKDAAGKIHYEDRPCQNATAQNYVPPPLTTITAERLTGGRKAEEKKKATDKWVSPLDPVAACHARGGEIDKEMRGCRLP